MKNNLSLENLRELHRKGLLDEAKQGYLQLLRSHPNDPEILHSIGILLAQQENYSDAVDYFEKAIEYQPQNPSLHLHLANSLKLQGLFTHALQVLQKAIETHPDYAPGFNNVGTIYYALGKFDKAKEHFQIAIHKSPTYIEAYYNLGLAFAKLNQLDEAIDAYQTVLRLKPEHFPARFQLANNFMKADKIDQALGQFLYLIENYPPHYETLLNTATCFLKNGYLNEAKVYYIKALEFSPEDLQIIFNLGVISMQQGHTDESIQYYQRLLHINPDYFPAHNNLGVASLAKNQVYYALYHFQEALRIQPKNEAIQHTVKVLSQNQYLLSSPPDYITALFDGYAEHYEPHLLKILEYKAPNIFEQVLKKILPAPSHQWDILDIGCGTGLCGPILKPYAKKLMGVDLSNKMLDIAKQKNCYDELVHADFNDYLAQHKRLFDLIIAADALVYTGDLNDTFKLVSESLTKNGYFIFNTEISEKSDFKLAPSGRFTHQKSYLEQLAKLYHLHVIHYETVILRQQNYEPVNGHLFVLSSHHYL